jgi:ribosomal protein S18 acetylase RimI-like enzyme
MVELSDNLVLRDAVADDLEAIVALEVAAFGEQDAAAVRTYFTALGPQSWTVVCHERQIVSASARIPHRFSLDGVEFPGAQIEYVATDPAFRRRGLVRAQFDRHHHRSEAAGDLAQFVGGIPYLYRRFGYGYGLDHPLLFLFDLGLAQPAEGIKVRPAQASDLEAVRALEELRRLPGLRTVRDGSRWELLFDLVMSSDYEALLLAEENREVVGWARLHRDDDEQRVYLLPSVVRTEQAVDALVRAANDWAGDQLLVGFDAPGTVFGRRSAALGSSIVYDLGIYTRIPDPLAMLEHLRPLLTERLRSSELATNRGELVISLYTTGVAIDYADGAIDAIRHVPPVEDPAEEGLVGVAPDWFGALVFGRFGARGLAERADDVLLGRHSQIMDVLFPKRPSDVAADL